MYSTAWVCVCAREKFRWWVEWWKCSAPIASSDAFRIVHNIIHMKHISHIVAYFRYIQYTHFVHIFELSVAHSRTEWKVMTFERIKCFSFLLLSFSFCVSLFVALYLSPALSIWYIHVNGMFVTRAPRANDFIDSRTWFLFVFAYRSPYTLQALTHIQTIIEFRSKSILEKSQSS